MHYQKDRVALKPPLGWNSWDCYGPAVNEVQLLGNARYMAEHLKAHGWQYVVCDIQWYEPEAGQRHWEYNRFAELCMDGFGRLIPAENRFPSAANGAGFKPIADQIHALGLKFGIHIMRGVPRLAVHRAPQGGLCPVPRQGHGADLPRHRSPQRQLLLEHRYVRR